MFFPVRRCYYDAYLNIGFSTFVTIWQVLVNQVDEDDIIVEAQAGEGTPSISSVTNEYLVPKPRAQRAVLPLLVSARNLVPTKKKSCLPFTSKSYSKFGTDVNIQGTVLSDGLIVDGWRHKGNSSNAPPGSAPCDSCGRFQTRLDAHQAGVHWLMALPLFHVLLSLAIEAWNSAIKFTLKGPNDELLTSAQQRSWWPRKTVTLQL